MDVTLQKIFRGVSISASGSARTSSDIRKEKRRCILVIRIFRIAAPKLKKPRTKVRGFSDGLCSN
jgi:hypothetical protein